jgi:hypothetical protein
MVEFPCSKQSFIDKKKSPYLSNVSEDCFCFPGTVVDSPDKLCG